MYRSIALVAIAFSLATSVALVPTPASAVEDGKIVIEGSGWGHGIGMSQYGAYGQALDGRTHDQILDFYYDAPGQNLTTIEDAGVSEPLWIGLEQEAVKVELKVVPIVGSGTSAVLERGTSGGVTDTVTVAVGSTVTIEHTAGGCVFTVGSGAPSAPGGCYFDLEWDGWNSTPTSAVQLVRHWEWGSDPTNSGAATSCRRWSSVTCTYDMGTAHVRPDNNRGLDVSLEIDLDDYIAGIGEMPSSWLMEALKTQAVASRSYALYVADYRTSRAGAGSYEAAAKSRDWCWCVLYDASDEGASGKQNDQAYRGRVPGITTGRWTDSVRATAGEIVAYRGEPIGAFFGSSNGGATENNEDVWGGTPIPYLRSRPDPYTLTAPGNPYPTWTYTKSQSTILSRLNLDSLTSAEIVDTFDSGTPSRIAFSGYRDGALVTVDTYRGDLIDGNTVAEWYGLRGTHITGFQVPGSTPPPPPSPSTTTTTTTAAPATPPATPTGFTDISDTIHRGDIQYLAERGIAVACDAGEDRFCPDDRMRREDIAAFLSRALDLPEVGTDFFTDDDGRAFEDDINRIAALGITKGCNPPTNDQFCPDNTVTRGQIAAFLVRAWHLSDPGHGDWFIDDDRSVFEGDIDRLATVGMTKGCNPPANDRYCPERKVTRAETASFLARALRDL
ncbi:MAG: SpoIID/LytB domain-containing protein [Actinomycetota bacterium]|nr:SpoIID/LytB domain-containing protein [Actinomycetota bacterium]